MVHFVTLKLSPGREYSLMYVIQICTAPKVITVFAPFRWAFVKRSWLFCSPSFSSLFFLSRCRSEEFNPGFICITIQGIDSAKFLARKSTKLQETSLLKSWSGKSWPICQHRFDEAIVPVIHCRQIKHTTIFAPGIAVNVTKQRRRKRRCVHYANTTSYVPRIIGG